MGFLHKFQHADYKMILILMTIISVCVLANIGWVILALRNYMNYDLNLFVQIPLDITASLIFNFFAFRVISTMAKDEPKIWTVTCHLCKDMLHRAISICCCRSKHDYAHAHERNFEFSDNDNHCDNDKCSICWEPYDAQSPQYLLNCGHRFHQCCLDEFESNESIYYQCPQCRTLYHEDSKWNYQYAYHLLHADNTLMRTNLLLNVISAMCLLANVGWIIYFIRESSLNPNVWISLILLIVFNYLCFSIISRMTRKESKIALKK